MRRLSNWNIAYITNYFSHLMEKMYELMRLQIRFFFAENIIRSRPLRSGTRRPRSIGPNG